MARVIIGIPEMDHTFFRAYMRSKYLFALWRAGAKVKTLRWTQDEREIQKYVAECDGILLPGGPDIDPALYGQQAIAACGKAHPERDFLELRLARLAVQANKPVLGICRGLQVLNVALGGSLLQDITPMQKRQHSDYAGRAGFAHRVTVKKPSRLYEIYEKEELQVDSMHHQAADTLGGGLQKSAESEDGFVEALELPANRFCVAVQWHPEHMAAKHPEQRAIFTAFVKACKKA